MPKQRWVAVLGIGLTSVLGTTAFSACQGREATTATTASSAAPTDPAAVRKAMLGRWRQVGGMDQLELGDDGLLRAKNDVAELNGKYIINSDGNLEINLGPLSRGAPVVRKVKIEQDRLLMTDVKSGVVFEYERIE